MGYGLWLDTLEGHNANVSLDGIVLDVGHAVDSEGGAEAEDILVS